MILKLIGIVPTDLGCFGPRPIVLNPIILEPVKPTFALGNSSSKLYSFGLSRVGALLAGSELTV